MSDDIHAELKTVLKAKPKRLTDLEQWLYVTVNTAKAIIDNSDKDGLNAVSVLAECAGTAELQQRFDIIQGNSDAATFPKDTAPIIFIFVHWLPIFPIRN